MQESCQEEYDFFNLRGGQTGYSYTEPQLACFLYSSHYLWPLEAKAKQPKEAMLVDFQLAALLGINTLADVVADFLLILAELDLL